MNRQRKMILLAHCLLNSNAKVEGLDCGSGIHEKLLVLLVEKGYGIIQLPCPEITLYGCKRWGHVKEQFDTPFFRKHCREIFMPIMEQIQDYLNNGYRIEYLVGIDGSPSCGVKKTCTSKLWGGEIGDGYGLTDKLADIRMINSEGIYIEEIEKLLIENKIQLKFIAVDEAHPEASIEIIQSLLKL